MWTRIRRTSGIWLASLSVAVTAMGCNYSLRAAGGFPSHIQTVAIIPFENRTTRLDLTQQLYDQLLREVPRSLGVRTAAEDVADAVVRGTITRYALEAPLYRGDPAGGRAEVLQRQVTIAVDVQIIDLSQNVILWEGSNVTTQGQFSETTESEDLGRDEALRLLIQKIIDGAQSNW